MNEFPYRDKKGSIYRFGEFFPTELSLYAYNESLAYEEFPLSQVQVEGQGLSWRISEEKYYTTTVESSSLPDSIGIVEDSILDETIACPNKGAVETQCTFAYKILPEELRLYRLMHIPLPQYCPNCRYHGRRDWKLPWKLWHRSCACDLSNHNHEGNCSNEFETSYAPERPEKVFCEDCYKREVL